MLGWPLLWRLAAAMGDSVTGKIGALILALRLTLRQSIKRKGGSP